MDAHPLSDIRLAVIGAGAMGEAMLAGLVDRRLIDPSRVTCSHPRAERRDALAAAHRVAVTADNAAAAREADIVLLAVKPQMLAGVMAELRGALRPDQLVISVIAGASTRALGEGLQHPAVVRSMPHTPLQSGRHVAELRDMVTSPGGTSAEALYQLEKGGLRTVVSDAVWAAFERTLQLEARLEGRDAPPGSGRPGR